MLNLEKNIQRVADKASNTGDSADAMRFSQAALNLAHTAITMVSVSQDRKGQEPGFDS